MFCFENQPKKTPVMTRNQESFKLGPISLLLIVCLFSFCDLKHSQTSTTEQLGSTRTEIPSQFIDGHRSPMEPIDGHQWSIDGHR